MKNLICLFFLIPSIALALEVDEKLTSRVVKVSETKKTVMINRGTEDGLVEGDHAKFIVTAGIVARGVCVKVSPTRSVWSIYRLVNADFIVNDSVMSLKITPPVKITKDETQALVQEDLPATGGGGGSDLVSLGIPLADGAQDLNSAANTALLCADYHALEDHYVPTSIVDRNEEVYGFINISGLSSQSKSTGSQSYNNSQSIYHLGFGGEFYPKKLREWYSRFSLIGELALMRENSQGLDRAGITNELHEFGIGANWHPTKLPSIANDFIPFFHLALNYGTVKATYQGTAGETSDYGSSSGFSLGFGYKFYTVEGFGVRMMVDYYTRTEKYYKDDTSGDLLNRVVSGPRVMIAISYRF